MSWTWHIVLGSFALIWPALGADCQPRAVSLPLKPYILDTQAVVRGISFQVGSRAQQTVIMPNAYLTGTYVWNSLHLSCPASSSSKACTTNRGGHIDPSESHVELATVIDGKTFVTQIRDDVQLQNTTGSGVNLTQFEIGVRNQDSLDPFVMQGELGLGTNSSFLKALAEKNETSSNSWALFWGTEVTKTPRDGSLTLGGYDEALIDRTSPNITLPLKRDLISWCSEGMVVTITGLSLKTSVGSQNVLRDLSPQEVCIVPTASSLLTLPVRYWDAMAALMKVDLVRDGNGTLGEPPLKNTTAVQAKTATFSGSLAITLNSSLEIVIPNEQLLFDFMYVEPANGIIRTRSDWKQTPIIRSDTATPRIGGMFFSAAYLMVNHDKNTFTITKAQTTAATQQLVAFDTANNCVAASNVTGAVPTTSSPLPTGSPESLKSTPRSGLTGGAIGGIVAGIVGGFAFLAGLVFFLFRRRRVAPNDAPPVSATPVEKYGHAITENAIVQTGDDRQLAWELDSTQLPSEAPQPGAALNNANQPTN